jgi:uncharacterized 2Fe-2S/4Fe-4S cluster protein (DUF4445 family)
MTNRADLRSWVRTVAVAPPSLRNNTADFDRLVQALRQGSPVGPIDADLDLVRRVPDLLRASGNRLRCVLLRDRSHWRLAGILGADDARPTAGLAVDLGTTRIVLALVDLADGRLLGETSCDNPQTAVGPDILTRIHYAAVEGGAARLQTLVREALNTQAADLCQSAGISPHDIYLAALAGNTAMTHLFLGLNPQRMIREPYIPVVNRPGVLGAATLGLAVNPHAQVLVFPNIGSYFGGDLIAGILFADLDRAAEVSLLVDVGTNAEVVLGQRDWLIGCAGAAGPALEGGVSRIGATAGPGMVDRVRIDPETGVFTCRTIGNRSPLGLCGSGIIDLAAQLFRAGMIDIRGKLVPEACGPRYREPDGFPALVVVPAAESGTGGDLTITQADLDSLVRSKAAMYTILETLTATVGVRFEDLAAFHVAGTFGAFIDPESAVRIGMLPDLPRGTFRRLGNSSLGGALKVLTEPEALERVDRIRDRITYLELNVNQEFMNRFSAAKFIPHTDRSRFPSAAPAARDNG